jgi:hypothetical protein
MRKETAPDSVHQAAIVVADEVRDLIQYTLTADDPDVLFTGVRHGLSKALASAQSILDQIERGA